MEEVYNKIGLVAPAAMILEARGAIQLHAARGTNQQAVPQLLLFPGDRLKLGADAGVQLIVLSELHKERLNPACEVIIRRKGCEPPDAIRERAANIPMTFVRLPMGTFYLGWGGEPRREDRSVRQGAEGEELGATNTSRRVPTEQVGVVRHAWQRVAMVRRPVQSGGLAPGVPGRQLVQRLLELPGGCPLLERAGQPELLPRPASRPCDSLTLKIW